MLMDVDGLCVVAFVDDLRGVVVNKLCEIISTERASVGRVFDRRSRRADELFQVRFGWQSTLLVTTHNRSLSMTHVILHSKLARARLTVDTSCQPSSSKFKVTWHKNQDRLQKSGPTKYSYCPLVKESAVTCQLPLNMADEINFENGKFLTFNATWPWPLPWIGPYGIPLCITHRPLPTHHISFVWQKLFVDGLHF